MIPFEIDQNAFKSAEGSAGYANPLSQFDIRPWLVRSAGTDSHLKRRNFLVRNWQGNSTISNDLLNARGHHNCSPVLVIKPAEQITREQRLFHFLDPVRPLAHALIGGEEALQAMPFKLGSDKGLLAGVNIQGIPIEAKVNFQRYRPL